MAICTVKNFGRATGTISGMIQERCRETWRQSLPSVVLSPTRLHGLGLARAVARARGSLLGVEFLTPELFRKWAVDLVPARVANGEAYRIALAAGMEPERCEQLSGLVPVLADLANRIAAAGGAIEEIASLRRYEESIRRAEQQLHAAGFVQPAAWDLLLLHEARKSPARLDQLIVTGFTGAHWELIHLILAAASLANEVHLVMENPRQPTEQLDYEFIGTLEHWLACDAQPLDCDQDEEPSPDLSCSAARNESEEADAAVAKIVRWLAEEPDAEIAVLVPERGILSRELSRRLEEIRIPHFDTYGRLRPGTLPSDAVAGWAEYQRLGTVSLFRDFLWHAGQLDGDFDRLLQDGFRETLSPAVAVVQAWYGSGAGGAFEEFPRLPSRGTVSEFVEAALRQFERLGWNHHAEALAQGRLELGDLARLEIVRSVWLDWFRGICRAFFAVRTPASANAFGRVAILRPEEIGSYQWSHLLVAGAVEGVWPPQSIESGLLDEREIRQLNRECSLASGGRTGRFGDGHDVLQLGRARLLSPRDHTAVERSRFLGMETLPTKCLAVSTHLASETAPDTPASPSEPFVNLYMKLTGQAITSEALAELAASGERDSRSLRLRQQAAARYGAVTHARQTRIDPTQPFDEFLFGYETPPATPIDLPATAWESMLTHPQSVWLDRVAKVRPRPDFDAIPFRASIGSWAHRWIAKCGTPDTFVPLPDTADRRATIVAAFEGWRSAVLAACSDAGQEPPVWWATAGRAALALALRMNDGLDTIDGIDEILTETNLSPGTVASGEDRFRTHGKADIVGLQASGLSTVVDFKTGNPTINARGPKYEQGQAVQIALYVFLLEEQFGNASTGWIVPAQGGEPIGPIKPNKEDAAWSILASIGTTGRFGMLGELRSEHGWSPDYPLALLPIDPRILKSKWARTHAPREEEDA